MFRGRGVVTRGMRPIPVRQLLEMLTRPTSGGLVRYVPENKLRLARRYQISKAWRSSLGPSVRTPVGQTEPIQAPCNIL
jgi:hypothetical protein